MRPVFLVTWPKSLPAADHLAGRAFCRRLLGARAVNAARAVGDSTHNWSGLVLGPPGLLALWAWPRAGANFDGNLNGDRDSSLTAFTSRKLSGWERVAGQGGRAGARKVVLAFSGGRDTRSVLHSLLRESGCPRR